MGNRLGVKKGKAARILLGSIGRYVPVSLLLALLPAPALEAQDADPSSQVEALLAAVTVEERVGQLFPVTFVGGLFPGRVAATGVGAQNGRGAGVRG